MPRSLVCIKITLNHVIERTIPYCILKSCNDSKWCPANIVLMKTLINSSWRDSEVTWFPRVLSTCSHELLNPIAKPHLYGENIHRVIADHTAPQYSQLRLHSFSNTGKKPLRTTFWPALTYWVNFNHVGKRTSFSGVNPEK